MSSASAHGFRVLRAPPRFFEPSSKFPAVHHSVGGQVVGVWCVIV